MFPSHDPGTRNFKRGCPIKIELIDAFTPLREEGSGARFKNYPGPPVTQQSGAKLPRYARKSHSQPVAISNFQASQLPRGLVINPNTGLISGAVEFEFAQLTITVTAENNVGRSVPVPIVLRGQSVIKCT